MRTIFSFFLIVIFIVASGNIFAQKNEVKDVEYRRSSLSLILMDEANMPKRDTIREAFLSAPMPDKYNDHNISVRYFDPAKLVISDADIAAYKEATAEAKGKPIAKTEEKSGKKKSAFGNFAKAVGKEIANAAVDVSKDLVAGTTSAVDTAAASSYAVKAHKYLMEQQVAKQLFDKWFIDGDGNFSVDLIQERGLYDASVMDIQTAKSSVRGMGMLQDAGEELINNTFVVVSRFRYMSRDELVAEIDALAQAVAGQFGAYASLGASAGTVALKASLGAGYYVQSTSFLFQLNWNEDISQTFYSDLWDNPSAYQAADIFSLKYIGQETAWAGVRTSIFTDKGEPELIRIATINATDAVLAKLEKKYDVFKTKTPLVSTEPLLAHIGMKEGVEGGDKFEVLEKVIDEKTGKTKYDRKAVIKVDKNQIWDNRYMADEENELTGKEQGFTATLFEGNGKNLYPGMLLRQIK